MTRTDGLITATASLLWAGTMAVSMLIAPIFGYQILLFTLGGIVTTLLLIVSVRYGIRFMLDRSTRFADQIDRKS